MSDDMSVSLQDDQFLPKVDPVQVEKEIVQEQLQRATTDYDPFEAAAKIFTMFLPQFRMLVRSMSNRQLRRLVMALIEVPLQKKDYKHPTKEEQAAFMVGDRLLQAKWAMMLQTLEEHARKQSVNAPPPGAVPMEEVLQNSSGSGSMDLNQGES